MSVEDQLAIARLCERFEALSRGVEVLSKRFESLTLLISTGQVCVLGAAHTARLDGIEKRAVFFGSLSGAVVGALVGWALKHFGG